MSAIQASVIFFGEVQGVSFRSTVRKYSINFGITGWVKNLPDGSVQAVFVGEKSNIEDLVKAIRQNSGFANISDMKIQFQKKQRNFTEFEIIP